MPRADNLAKARAARTRNAAAERAKDPAILRAWRKWLDDEKVLYDAKREGGVGSPAHRRWLRWRKAHPMPDLARVETAIKRERGAA